MSELTREHLETFAFDPHCATEPEITAMARELINARSRLAEPPQSDPVGYAVTVDAPDSARFVQAAPVASRADAEARARFYAGLDARVVELREARDA